METFGDFGKRSVRAADFKSLVEQNFRDTAHSDAANTNKM
jgi:hypothetical protein